MDERELLGRTKQFALRVIRLVSALSSLRTVEARAVAGQLMRAGTSVGANYRAACRARSKAEFVSRLGVVEEEADECCFWLELIIEARLMKPDTVRPLLREANEIVAIVVASRRTVSGHRAAKRE